MKPQFDLRTLRPLSRALLSGLPPNAFADPNAHPTRRFSGLHRSTVALVLIGLGSASLQALAQQPAPIPNWPTDNPGTTASQYSPNSQYGQPQYQQAAAIPTASGLWPAAGLPPAGLRSAGLQRSHPGFCPALPAGTGPQSRSPRADGRPHRPLPRQSRLHGSGGSTYPAQVAAADQWLHMQGGAPPEQIAAGANAQTTLGPSVKALTAFPQVLDQMAQNLAMDHRPRQCLLQPATGRDADHPGDARSRPGSRQSPEHPAAGGHRRPGQHRDRTAHAPSRLRAPVQSMGGLRPARRSLSGIQCARRNRLCHRQRISAIWSRPRDAGLCVQAYTGADQPGFPRAEWRALAPALVGLTRR